MAEIGEFVGVIPYSVYGQEPVALIWRHSYTSPVTRADTDFYSELIIRKQDDTENCTQAISRMLSKISKGAFIKSSTDKTEKENINKCYNKLLSNINKFKGVAILENNNGYKVYLIPVKFIKTKTLHQGIKNNVYYKECHWISFNKLLSTIYEINDIKKMSVISIENYKHKKNKNKKLCNYNHCRLSLQFASLLRSAHFRVIVPLFHDIKVQLNDDVITEKEINNDEEKKNEIIIESAYEKEETFIIQCKKCRHKLFSDLFILEHSLNVIDLQCSMKSNVCNCIFLNGEDLNVLKLLSKMGNTSEMNGLLTCFNCKFKIGRFNYYGEQCSCDEWICPSFQISVSKVDISRKRQKFFKTNQAQYFKSDESVQINEGIKCDQPKDKE